MELYSLSWRRVEMLRSHVLVLSILPVILNNLVTPVVIVSEVSLSEFLKSPAYYIYTYGLPLWSIYHFFLAGLAVGFFKVEKQDLKEVIGPVKDKPWLTVFMVTALLVLSMLLFQVIEPHVADLVYGQEMWKEFLREYKKISLALAVYGIAVTSLTAGVCEEIVWRGYLQTRFEQLFHGRFWTAILLQALLFGLWHGVSVHTLFTAISGFIYGVVYSKTRKLLPIMVSHWLGDVIGFSTTYYM
jgi:membrane protease YdiL (CAAX protease family)